MPWNDKGGGGPWNGNGGPGPWGRGPSGGNRGSKPPNIEDLFKQGQDRFRQFLGGGSGRIAGLVVLILLALWGLSGFYFVAPDEQGVVLRFGAYEGTTQPGLHYHLPVPIETVRRPKVTRVNRTEVGVTEASGVRGAVHQEVPEEALMLTGDENIVDINLSVLWVVKDARAYLFNIRNPEATVKSAAEAAVREVVGRTLIASVLAEGRGLVENDTQQLLQKILDSYGAGITVTQVQLQRVDPPEPVIEAFRDVQRAQTDLESARNEAEAYRNDIVPRARGAAEQIEQDAGAYKQQIIAGAQGDAQRFLSVLNAYRAAKDVTAERLYLETMEQVLRNANKILVDKSAGVAPYLPLPAPVLTGKPPAAPAASTPPALPPVPSVTTVRPGR
ncbi:MAG TPA: FtsH protease activity modulator HflK [Aliidongia sp.]|nr:FtsH protease activity modulator HflK [Aliidongia sp.]